MLSCALLCSRVLSCAPAQIELHSEVIPTWYPPRGPFLKRSSDAGRPPRIIQPPSAHHRFFWALMRAGWAIFHKEPNTAYAMGACVEYGFIRLGWDASALIDEAKKRWCVRGWRNVADTFLPRCEGWGSLPADADVTALTHLGYVSNENYGKGGRPRNDVLLVRSNHTGMFERARQPGWRGPPAAVKH